MENSINNEETPMINSGFQNNMDNFKSTPRKATENGTSVSTTITKNTMKGIRKVLSFGGWDNKKPSSEAANGSRSPDEHVPLTRVSMGRSSMNSIRSFVKKSTEEKDKQETFTEEKQVCEEKDADTVSTKSPKAETEEESSLPKRGFKERISFRSKKTPARKELFKEPLEESPTEDLVIVSPTTPLSVMQINKLIYEEILEDAYSHLCLLKNELKSEDTGAGSEGYQMELEKKRKDVQLLYGSLQDKIKNIIIQSNHCPDEHLSIATKIIANEAEAEQENSFCLAGLQKWIDLWKSAILESAKKNIEEVYSTTKKNQTCLAVHLANLGMMIVSDLKHVKNDLRYKYPESLSVCEAYADGYHQATSLHLKDVIQPVINPLSELALTSVESCGAGVSPDSSGLKAETNQYTFEYNDLYAVLKWVIKDYVGEAVLGDPDLKPEVNPENMSSPLLDDDTLSKLKREYCDKLQVMMERNLENILKEELTYLEKKTKPEVFNNCYHSELKIDIIKMVNDYLVASKDISEDVETSVLGICCKKIKHFLKSFQNEFRNIRNVFKEDYSTLSMHMIAYINSFNDIKQTTECYKEQSLETIEQLNKELEDMITNLKNILLDCFKTETKPYFDRLMTEGWLTNNDFEKIIDISECYTEHFRNVMPPYAEVIVNDVHLYAVKQYVAQIMIQSTSYKGTNHRQVARKICLESKELSRVFEEMGTTATWLNSAGTNIGEIIEAKGREEINKKIKQLYDNYPDVSQNHISAILYFRGLQCRKHQSAIQYFQELKRQQPGKDATRDHQLFHGISTPNHSQCFFVRYICK
uniref:Exocyst complex component 3 n=1 Tax=Erpetoichthys calabaricus TaxID=27687 RepID=A0A8C4T5V9_ERPCA